MRNAGLLCAVLLLTAWRARGDSTGPDAVAVADADIDHAGQAMSEALNTHFG